MMDIEDDPQPQIPDPDDLEDSEMAPLNPKVSTSSNAVDGDQLPTETSVEYRVYKRRFFGLTQLVLFNIIWLTFSAVSATSAEFFSVSESAVNWLSTGFLFAFVAVTPFTIWALHKGPKTSIVISAVLLLIGNWVRYAGTRAGESGHFGVVVFGQILIGFAQPFVLAAPTRYSDLWFTDRGRVSATAVASLANPLGGALGQLVGPFWAAEKGDIPNMVLYTAIISCIACLPAFFVPSKPPTPPSESAAQDKPEIMASIKALGGNKSFILLSLSFSVYVGFFNASSSLINQIFEPYGYSETQAGIAGAILIVVGLIASAIVSPIVDRTKQYLITIKLFVPLIAIGYLVLIFTPETETVVAPYIVCALLGASSFSLLPCALEYLVEITHPVSPEVSSTLCWAGGQLLGAVFIIIMDALKGGLPDQPQDTMKRSLIFQAVISWVAVPCALVLGHIDRDNVKLGRTRAEVTEDS